MRRRIQGSYRAKARAALACVCLVAPALCALVVAGCGSGDDTVSIAPLVGDAGGDATTAKPDQEAGVKEANLQDSTTVEEENGPESGEASSPRGSPVAMLSIAPINLGSVACSSTGTATLGIANTGTRILAVSATTTGTAFSVSPSSISVAPNEADAGLVVTAMVPGSSAAGTALTGSLNLFTSDPKQPSIAIPLSVTPMGATILVSPATANFPSTESNAPAPAVTLGFQNIGNAPASVSVVAPSDPNEFSISGVPDGGTGASIAPKGTLNASAGFTPKTTTSMASATSTVIVSGVTCGTSVSSISYEGSVGHGVINGWPSNSTIDFGPAACGGTEPTYQILVLTNSGNINATITSATITNETIPGFTVSGQGGVIPAKSNGIPGSNALTLHAPPVPFPSPTTPITATLTVQTDAETTAHTITLTEEPTGAVLAFSNTQTTPPFGSFGPIVLLQAATQNFSVTNGGSAPADVTLSIESGSGAGTPFTLSNASFTVPPGTPQTDSVIFSPTGASNAGTLSMSTSSTLCAPLPSPQALSGSGISGGPSIAPTSLMFTPTCGRPAATPQSFTVTNVGSLNLNWAMSDPTGPGSDQYSVTAAPPAGLLEPGQSSTVTVTPQQVPSPAPNPSPSAFAASLTITTDVPFDAPHVVSLGETPLGDQLSTSVPSMRFGQFPINTATVPQTFTVTNNANPGSPSANVSLALGGTAAAAYTLVPTALSNIAPGGGVSAPENVTFEPKSVTRFPAHIAFSTSDALCTPLPDPIQLGGTGTQGVVSVSASQIAFGTDPSDVNGFVNCGATGLAHTLTVSNTGNAPFNITALTLGLGSNSPYVLSGDAATLPASVPIGGSASITVTPKAIPSQVANPSDASPFTDSLMVTTDAALDSPHVIPLIMQARGAVIANTPLSTTWAFGVVDEGSSGAFTSTIQNTGNAAASIAISGLMLPKVFGLETNPTTALPNEVTTVTGTFSPPSANGVWTDVATLAVTPAQVFCEPLPSQWQNPQVAFSGSANSKLPVTISGSLAFPTTDCGSSPPAGQTITLTNVTNTPYAFTAGFSSGQFYTVYPGMDGGAGSTGSLAAFGSATIIVNPKAVTPGQGVMAGTAPYFDNLLVAVQSSPVTNFTVPVGWGLNGAVLSLPNGLGTNKDSQGNPFYPADSTSGFELPIANSGTASATVSFGLQPANAFTFSPTPPIPILTRPSPTLPRLSSTSSDATCPSLTSGSVTFVYSGPVCQPLPYAQVSIQSCVGAL